MSSIYINHSTGTSLIQTDWHTIVGAHVDGRPLRVERVPGHRLLISTMSDHEGFPASDKILVIDDSGKVTWFVDRHFMDHVVLETTNAMFDAPAPVAEVVTVATQIVYDELPLTFKDGDKNILALVHAQHPNINTSGCSLHSVRLSQLNLGVNSYVPMETVSERSDGIIHTIAKITKYDQHGSYKEDKLILKTNVYSGEVTVHLQNVYGILAVRLSKAN